MRRALFNALLSVLLASVLATPGYTQGAPSAEEIAQIRAQLQSLMRRVDRLEERNEALAAENEKLRSRDEHAKPGAAGGRQHAVRSADAAKSNDNEWTDRVTLKGDLRYRHEQISDETLNASGVQNTADRYRDRVRARVTAEVEATDSIALGIGFSTAENGDPRSANQTLDGGFSRKSLELSLAYFDWKFAEWGGLIGGKMKQPFVTPGQSLFWDSDINPEGLAVTFSEGVFFGSAYNYWIDEVSGPESATTADTMLRGAQFGARLPFGASSLTLAAHYYDLSAGEGRAPFFNNNPFGNTTRDITSGATTTAVLAYDFEVIDVMAEFNTELGALPFQVWADVAQNQDPDELDTAWGAGVMFGKASAPRSWELGAAYQLVEKDALFAQLIDATFAGGHADAEGWVLRGAYAPVRNWVLNATYYMNERNADVENAVGQRGVDYDRFQLDMSVKF